MNSSCDNCEVFPGDCATHNPKEYLQRRFKIKRELIYKFGYDYRILSTFPRHDENPACHCDKCQISRHLKDIFKCRTASIIKISLQAAHSEGVHRENESIAQMLENENLPELAERIRSRMYYD